MSTLISVCHLSKDPIRIRITISIYLHLYLQMNLEVSELLPLTVSHQVYSNVSKPSPSFQKEDDYTKTGQRRRVSATTVLIANCKMSVFLLQGFLYLPIRPWKTCTIVCLLLVGRPGQEQDYYVKCYQRDFPLNGKFDGEDHTVSHVSLMSVPSLDEEYDILFPIRVKISTHNVFINEDPGFPPCHRSSSSFLP